MKVVDARAVLLSHDYGVETTLAWVGGRIETWDAALVQVRTEDGVTGLGEVAQGIMAAPAVPGVLEALLPYLLGLDLSAPHEVGDALRDRTAFWSRGGVASGVVSAIETAAWDAAGKSAGRPAHQLMEPRQVTDVEVYASGGLGVTPEQILEWARLQEAAGFGTVKFRAMGDPDLTLALLDQVVPQLAPGTRFVLDAVQGCARRAWPVDDAVRVGRRVAALSGRWFEEPCRAEDPEGFAAVRSAVDVPVSGVESYGTRQEFLRLMEKDGVDVVQPDAAMVGGPTELRRVASAARDRGLDVVPHVWGTGVTLMANLHTALATEGMGLVEWCTLPNPLRDAVLVDPPAVTGSRVAAPTSAGLGVQLPPEVEERFPFLPGRGHVIA